jgi:hypothetical protein
MARGPTIVFTNPQILITTSTAGNSTTSSTSAAPFYNVSEWFRSIQLDISADEKEDTTFGLTAKSRVQGLFDWGFEAEANKDFLSSGVISFTGTSGQGGAFPATAPGQWSLDGLTYDLLNNKAKFHIFVRPYATQNRSSDNPEYWGPVRLFTHRGVGGAIGDVLTTPLSFKGSGNFNRFTSTT